MTADKPNAIDDKRSAHEEYLALFDTPLQAGEFETGILSIGEEFLPDWVTSLSTTDARYWRWLADTKTLMDQLSLTK